MSDQKYFVVPQGLDGCEMPTTMEPLALSEIGAHIGRFLEALAYNSKMMGREPSFSNAKREHIPLCELCFRLEPAVFEENENEDGKPEIGFLSDEEGVRR